MPSTSSDAPISTAEVADLSGRWSVARPHREVIIGQITRAGENRYQFSNLDNLNDTYEVWKDKLILDKPLNKSFKGLAWTIESPQRLKVVHAPPIASVGSEYRGTVAEKLGSK